MKKGFFSHQICCGQSCVDKHILYLSPDNRIDSLLPFHHETPHTTFCDGLLIATLPTFAGHENEFIATLSQQLRDNNTLTIGDAILQNETYHRHCTHDRGECLLYRITNIDWRTKRPHADSAIGLQRIL